MRELQDFAKVYQKEMNWEINAESYKESKSSLLNNYMLLTTEVAEVAEELRKAFNLTKKHSNNGMSEADAFELAKETIKQDLGKEFADCLAYICKIANFFDIDLEQGFYSKMEEVKNRVNKDI
ncbi:NTP pyrophosphatase (non-canonical NTP hydrolase) [Bacillus sp. SORGH_AS 510]|uniref:MazG nucleotide pyrophosphohydrolase domain-containing protein n=1 Tax=Bacillus sp. SORGH_AS_0510 TaxID=3041771 RepID=UPI00278BAC2A|nr:MazG nucleotide pyrophosphohydrolase domain-containing protein [Bacillus sp. SORGH_AS_0510]MDQ1147038.1 NTP pyrophosphatase (non-canonical NTP hydrolase) [Bacillus sp. SORGH_AS_0510]